MLVVEKAAKHDAGTGTGGAAISVVSPPCRSTAALVNTCDSSTQVGSS